MIKYRMYKKVEYIDEPPYAEDEFESVGHLTIKRTFYNFIKKMCNINYKEDTYDYANEEEKEEIIRNES